MVNRDLESMRDDYSKFSLRKSDLDHDPMVQLNNWFKAAQDFGVDEPNIMSLATVDGFGRPSNRILLLKAILKEGLVFYTNYQSKKAKDLNYNRYVAGILLWKEMQRQVRFEGVVEKVSREESESYFQSRPRESQIGAWSSFQSKVIEDRDHLESQQKEVENRFKDLEKLPLPEFWGGYIIIPNKIEFWQGRISRLHDRFQYTRKKEEWLIQRLSP